MQLKNIRLICILIAAGCLLLIPAVAMRFTDEVNWKPLTFIAMGFMLLCTALAVEFALRTIKVTWGKVVAVVAVLFGFVLVWGALVRMSD